MSWHFSRALVEEYLAASCSDGEPSALSNTTPTPAAYYWPDKTTEHSRLSRFGMTSEPLTVSLGQAALMWFLAASPAKISAQPAKVLDSTASEVDSGAKWQGSFAKYDRNTSLWKTAQFSLLGDSEEFLETWPRWGSMRSGASFLRPIPALTICENESGLWQTPVADDAVSRVNGKINSRVEPKLSAEVKMWPTPNVIGFRSDGELKLLASASASEQEYLRMSSRAARSKQERHWPTATATATASKGSSQASLKRKDGSSRENDRLDHAVMASDNGQLNPDWVEWLMGWPIGQTALKPLEMVKFQEWSQQHGRFSNHETD